MEFGHQARDGTGDAFTHANALIMTFNILSETMYADKLVRPYEKDSDSIEPNNFDYLSVAVMYYIFDYFKYFEKGKFMKVIADHLSIADDVGNFNSYTNILLECLCYIQMMCYTGVFDSYFEKDLTRLYVNYITVGNGIYNGITSYKGKFNELVEYIKLSKVAVEFVHLEQNGTCSKSFFESEDLVNFKTTKGMEELREVVDKFCPSYLKNVDTRLAQLGSSIDYINMSSNDYTLLLSTLSTFRYLAIFNKGFPSVAGKKNLWISNVNPVMSIYSQHELDGIPYTYTFDPVTEGILNNYIQDDILPYVQQLDINSINLAQELFNLQTTSVAHDRNRVSQLTMHKGKMLQKKQGLLIFYAV
jgi:hypothetical protein